MWTSKPTSTGFVWARMCNFNLKIPPDYVDFWHNNFQLPFPFQGFDIFFACALVWLCGVWFATLYGRSARHRYCIYISASHPHCRGWTLKNSHSSVFCYILAIQSDVFFFWRQWGHCGQGPNAGGVYNLARGQKYVFNLFSIIWPWVCQSYNDAWWKHNTCHAPCAKIRHIHVQGHPTSFP